MQTLEKTIGEFEDIIRTNLKVSNPVLLKTGTLGVLTNYLANIKHDVVQYYSKMYQEMNPGLATDFKSMLFHSTLYNNKIELADSSTFGASLIIPELFLRDVKSLEYFIPAWSSFQDKSSNWYTTYKDIKIVMDTGGVKAVAWDKTSGTIELSSTKVENPNLPGSYIHVIYYPEFKQQQRNFYKFIIPESTDDFSFGITIQDYRTIKNTTAWLNTKDPIDINSLELINPLEIADKFHLDEFNIKYYNYNSSRYDLDLFLDIQETSIQLGTGDGINGRKLVPGDEIIFMLELTNGINGNLNQAEFILDNVMVRERFLQGKDNVYNTTLNAISKHGGSGGKSIQTTDEIRKNIFNKISSRNSIVTENDYEIAFTIDGIRPFIDSKFIDARSFIFIFNALRINGRIQSTTSFNLTEELIASNPFFPKKEYNGRTLISPFYYKRINANETVGYIVNPNISIDLIQEDNRTIDTDNRLQIRLQYDFIERKSKLKIISGADLSNNYKFQSTAFSCELNSGNEFTYEINTRFTDTYCIVNNIITEIKLDIFSLEGEHQGTFFSDKEYYQLKKKQTFFKYYRYFEEAKETELYETLDTVSYLDNVLNDILSSIDDLIVPKQLGFVPYLLRLPFIDEDDINQESSESMWNILDTYFKTEEINNDINYNTKAVQSFYNTIDIQPRYNDHLFKNNMMGELSSSILPVNIDIVYNERNLLLSNFNSLFEFEVQIKIECIKFLKKKEGFAIRFYETELENLLYNKFANLLDNNDSENLKVIQNIRVNEPQTLVINNPETIFENVNSDNTLGFNDLLDFVPPYFAYDYANLTINFSK